mmetsp:Transcript_21570/g.32971  ORF Transcript_21570/g.32971 Transcript_21570/m.32971 type:complete len:382 (-) Transcript_21570:31-1176(-)
MTQTRRNGWCGSRTHTGRQSRCNSRTNTGRLTCTIKLMTQRIIVVIDAITRFAGLQITIQTGNILPRITRHTTAIKNGWTVHIDIRYRIGKELRTRYGKICTMGRNCGTITLHGIIRVKEGTIHGQIRAVRCMINRTASIRGLIGREFTVQYRRLCSLGCNGHGSTLIVVNNVVDKCQMQKGCHISIITHVNRRMFAVVEIESNHRQTLISYVQVSRRTSNDAFGRVLTADWFWCVIIGGVCCCCASSSVIIVVAVVRMVCVYTAILDLFHCITCSTSLFITPEMQEIAREVVPIILISIVCDIKGTKMQHAVAVAANGFCKFRPGVDRNAVCNFHGVDCYRCCRYCKEEKEGGKDVLLFHDVALWLYCAFVLRFLCFVRL